MADISTLKALKPSAKGEPPARAEAPRNTQNAPREKKEANKPLQVQVPESLFEAFGEEAGREFGFTHGAKSRLFIRMWEVYRERKGNRS